MSKTALIQVRIDETDKSEADSLFGSLGLDTPTAVRMFIKSVLRHGGLPFQVGPVPNRVTRQAIADIENGVGVSGPFTSSEELISSLLGDEDAQAPTRQAA
jgi:DNA-damage-inducible protein J